MNFLCIGAAAAPNMPTLKTFLDYQRKKSVKGEAELQLAEEMHEEKRTEYSGMVIAMMIAKSALYSCHSLVLGPTVCAESHGNHTNTSDAVNKVVFYHFRVVVGWSTFEPHYSVGEPVYTTRYGKSKRL